MTDSNDTMKFQETLHRAQHIIVIAGAGLSAASGECDSCARGAFLKEYMVITGIPTFRGAGGLWRSLNATELATPEAFEENPSLVWQFYHHRRVK